MTTHAGHTHTFHSEYILMREVGHTARAITYPDPTPTDRHNEEQEHQHEAVCPGVALMQALESIGLLGEVNEAEGEARDWEAQENKQQPSLVLEGLLPVHCAAFSGCEKCLEHIHRHHGADLSARDRMDRTPVYWAVAGGAAGNVRYLLERGANVSDRTHVGRTLLTKAAWCDLPEVVGRLLDSGAIFDQRDHKGRTAMHVAVTGGSRATISALLDRLGPSEPMRFRDCFGATPFHVAAGGTDPIFSGTLEFLVEQVRRRDPRNGTLVRELAELRNAKGDTPLVVGVAKGSTRAVQALMALDGPSRLREPNIFEAAVVAASTGNAPALKLLAPRVDKDRLEGLLTLACQAKQPRCVSVLLSLGDEGEESKGDGGDTVGWRKTRKSSLASKAALSACLTPDDLAAAWEVLMHAAECGAGQSTDGASQALLSFSECLSPNSFRSNSILYQSLIRAHISST